MYVCSILGTDRKSSNVKYGIFTIIAFSLMMCVLSPNIAYATSISYTFTTADEFSGGAGGVLSGTGVTVTIDDEDTAGSVIVKVDATGLTLTEKVRALYLNVSPESLLTDDPMTAADAPDPAGPPDDINPDSVVFSADTYMPDGDGLFDILSSWTNMDPINEDEISVYTLSATGLTASSFQTLSTAAGGDNDKGPFQVVLRVTSLDDDGEGSGWFSGTFDDNGVPPGSIPMAVGGEFIGIDTTAVLAAGAQNTAAWMIPVIIAAAGLGIVIARKF